MAKANDSKLQAAGLNSEEQERAERILQHLRAHADQHLQELAILLASKSDRELFGKTEFEARDIILKIGQAGMQAAIDARQKKGLSGC